MSLIKEAILRFRAEGAERVATAGRQIATSVEKAAAGTVSLAGGFSKAATAAGLLGSVLGSSSSPLLSGIGQIAQGAGIGASFGGVHGALIGGGIAAAGLAVGALSGSGEQKVEINHINVNNHINVPLNDGAINRAADRIRDAAREAMERRLFNFESAASERLRLGREAGAARLPR